MTKLSSIPIRDKKPILVYSERTPDGQPYYVHEPVRLRHILRRHLGGSVGWMRINVIVNGEEAHWDDLVPEGAEVLIP